MGIRSDLFRSSKCLVSKKHQRRIMQCCYSTHEIPHVTNNAHTWMFPKIVIPQNGWFIMENPIKMDDLGVPPFTETSTSHGLPEFWTLDFQSRSVLTNIWFRRWSIAPHNSWRKNCHRHRKSVNVGISATGSPFKIPSNT